MVLAVAQICDTLGVNVKAQGVELLAEFNGQG